MHNLVGWLYGFDDPMKAWLMSALGAAVADLLFLPHTCVPQVANSHAHRERDRGMMSQRIITTSPLNVKRYPCNTQRKQQPQHVFYNCCLMG